MRVLKTIIKVFKKFQNRNLTELDLLERALIRTQETLDLMEKEGRLHCCPSCFYGKKYTKLCVKEERQKEWLDILKKKNSAPSGEN